MTTKPIIVICGPTAVGKTTVVKKLLQKLNYLSTAVTYTTRAKRAESEDKDMRYISQQEFEDKIREDHFLEWAEFSGDYYGTSKPESLETLKHKPLLLNIEVKGSLQIKSKFPNALLIYILPENLEQLLERFRQRGWAGTKFTERKEAAEWSLSQADKFDYQVVNKEGLVEHTVDQIAKIIEAYIG